MVEKKTDDGEYITLTRVKELGFSPAMVDKLLPPEAMRKNNFRYPNGPKIRLWRLSDVLAVMATEEYEEAYAAYQRRSKPARERAERRADALAEAARERASRVSIKKLKRKQLMHDAVEHKRLLDAVRNRDEYWDSDPAAAPEEDKLRWAVNYIRHQLTDYDYEIGRFEGKVGRLKAYCAYQNELLDRIAATYPYLAEECERQKKRPDSWERAR